jgi:uncharacterized protein
MKQILQRITPWKAGFQGLLLSLAAIALATLVAVAPAAATGVYQMPILHAGDRTWTIDDAEVLSRLTEGNLSKALGALQKDTGNEVRLVTIRRLDYGETIDSFTEKLFEKWFPTPEEEAHQTLLVVDTLTNNSAIRTGDDLKSLLTAEIAESVAQETLQVPLREGDKYNQALTDVSDRLIAVLSGQPDPGPPIVDTSLNIERTFATAEETDTGNATMVVIVLLVLATVIPMATYYFYQGGFLQ